jgi:hypothetical protein
VRCRNAAQVARERATSIGSGRALTVLACLTAHLAHVMRCFGCRVPNDLGTCVSPATAASQRNHAMLRCPAAACRGRGLTTHAQLPTALSCDPPPQHNDMPASDSRLLVCARRTWDPTTSTTAFSVFSGLAHLTGAAPNSAQSSRRSERLSRNERFHGRGPA